MDNEAREWLDNIVGDKTLTSAPQGQDGLQEALKSGVYLCKAINVIKPGAVPKINESKMAFKMVRLIYIDCCMLCISLS